MFDEYNYRHSDIIGNTLKSVSFNCQMIEHMDMYMIHKNEHDIKKGIKRIVVCHPDYLNLADDDERVRHITENKTIAILTQVTSGMIHKKDNIYISQF